MSKLSKRDRQRIIEILGCGEELPLDYKHVLFPPEKKEYELVYAGKEREEDILANTGGFNQFPGINHSICRPISIQEFKFRKNINSNKDIYTYLP